MRSSAAVKKSAHERAQCGCNDDLGESLNDAEIEAEGAGGCLQIAREALGGGIGHKARDRLQERGGEGLKGSGWSGIGAAMLARASRS